VKIFIAVASSETQYTKSLRSVYELTRRDGDHIFVPETASYGSVTRTVLLEAFRRSTEYDAYLALDADQKHPRDLLEHLRARMETQGLDMVCAHYYRRQTDPIQSLCYELGDGTWPYQPYLDPPTSGLHEIGSTGQGCVLIHRRVIEAVWATLPDGDNPFDIMALPEVGGDQRKFGSDMGFFLRARQLGYRLWLDADAGESLHAITIWLGHKSAAKLQNYTSWANDHQELLAERLRIHGVNAEAVRHRIRICEARQRGLVIELENARREGAGDDDAKVMELSVNLYVCEGMIKENGYWLTTFEKYPPITEAADLPTTANMPLEAVDVAEVLAGREAMHQENAVELVKELPRLPNARNGVGHA
jgi:hypothetical protein